MRGFGRTNNNEAHKMKLYIFDDEVDYMMLLNSTLYDNIKNNDYDENEFIDFKHILSEKLVDIKLYDDETNFGTFTCIDNTDLDKVQEIFDDIEFINLIEYYEY